MRQTDSATVVVAVVMAAVLVAALPAAAAIKVTYWDLFSGGDGEFMTAMVQEFNKTHPDIVVEETVITWADYYNRLMTAILGGDAPDVAILHASHIAAFAGRGVLYGLDAEFGRVDFPVSDFVRGPWEQGKHQGIQYGVPLDVHPLVIYYNKDILQRAGLLTGGSFAFPKDRDRFMSILRQVKASTGKTPLSFEFGGFGAYRAWYATFSQAGGSLLGPGGSVGVNTPAALETLQWWASLASEFGLSGMNYDESVELFRNGDAAFHLNGVWVTGLFEQASGLNFAAAPFPSLFGGAQSWANSHMFVVPRQSRMDPQKVRAVLTFVEWMTRNGSKWAVAGHIPVRKSVLSSSEFKNLRYRSDYASQVENLAYLPQSPDIVEIETVVSDEVMAAVAGAKSPAQALKDMESRIKEILAK